MACRLMLGRCLLFVAASSSVASEDLDMRYVLSVAKMAGACGILDESLHFQAVTKMPGGDDFVERFWRTETARLGMSIEDFMKKCNEVVQAYEFFWAAAEEIPGSEREKS